MIRALVKFLIVVVFSVAIAKRLPQNDTNGENIEEMSKFQN